MYYGVGTSNLLVYNTEEVINRPNWLNRFQWVLINIKLIGYIFVKLIYLINLGVLKSSSESEKKKIITHAWAIIFQYFMYLKSNLRSLLYRENDKRN